MRRAEQPQEGAVAEEPGHVVCEERRGVRDEGREVDGEHDHHDDLLQEPHQYVDVQVQQLEELRGLPQE